MPYANKKTAIAKANERIAKNYDRINLTIPKGKRAIIQQYAKANNTSVNKLIWKLLEEELSKGKE